MAYTRPVSLYSQALNEPGGISERLRESEREMMTQLMLARLGEGGMEGLEELEEGELEEGLGDAIKGAGGMVARFGGRIQKAGKSWGGGLGKGVQHNFGSAVSGIGKGISRAGGKAIGWAQKNFTVAKKVRPVRAPGAPAAPAAPSVRKVKPPSDFVSKSPAPTPAPAAPTAPAHPKSTYSSSNSSLNTIKSKSPEPSKTTTRKRSNNYSSSGQTPNKIKPLRASFAEGNTEMTPELYAAIQEAYENCIQEGLLQEVSLDPRTWFKKKEEPKKPAGRAYHTITKAPDGSSLQDGKVRVVGKAQQKADDVAKGSSQRKSAVQDFVQNMQSKRDQLGVDTDLKGIPTGSAVQKPSLVQRAKFKVQKFGADADKVMDKAVDTSIKVGTGIAKATGKATMAATAVGVPVVGSYIAAKTGQTWAGKKLYNAGFDKAAKAIGYKPTWGDFGGRLMNRHGGKIATAAGLGLAALGVAAHKRKKDREAQMYGYESLTESHPLITEGLAGVMDEFVSPTIRKVRQAMASGQGAAEVKTVVPMSKKPKLPGYGWLKHPAALVGAGVVTGAAGASMISRKGHYPGHGRKSETVYEEATVTKKAKPIPSEYEMAYKYGSMPGRVVGGAVGGTMGGMMGSAAGAAKYGRKGAIAGGILGALGGGAIASPIAGLYGGLSGMAGHAAGSYVRKDLHNDSNILGYAASVAPLMVGIDPIGGFLGHYGGQKAKMMAQKMKQQEGFHESCTLSSPTYDGSSGTWSIILESATGIRREIRSHTRDGLFSAVNSFIRGH